MEVVEVVENAAEVVGAAVELVSFVVTRGRDGSSQHLAIFGHSRLDQECWLAPRPLKAIAAVHHRSEKQQVMSLGQSRGATPFC